jgi:hypothetical protein
MLLVVSLKVESTAISILSDLKVFSALPYGFFLVLKPF